MESFRSTSLRKPLPSLLSGSYLQTTFFRFQVAGHQYCDACCVQQLCLNMFEDSVKLWH